MIVKLGFLILSNVGTALGLWLREPPKMSGTVPLDLEDNVADAGTTATEGRAVAVAAAAVATGLGGLKGGGREEGKSTRFGCEWGVIFEAILSLASAVVVVSRSSWLLNPERPNSVSGSKSVRATVTFSCLAICNKVSMTVGERSLPWRVSMVDIMFPRAGGGGSAVGLNGWGGGFKTSRTKQK